MEFNQYISAGDGGSPDLKRSILRLEPEGEDIPPPGAGAKGGVTHNIPFVGSFH